MNIWRRNFYHAGKPQAVLVMVLVLVVSVRAAITGQVEEIGFQNTYRPDCWTPMLVSVHPDGAEGNYFLQVVQEDLDRDRVVYQRSVTLAGGTAEQRFWTCFIPQPTDGGLPEASEGLAALAAKLKVYLADSTGKPIAQMLLAQPITNIDPSYSKMGMQRGTKMVLAVADSGSGDGAPLFDYEQVRGVKEAVSVLAATPADLPDDPLGYEGLDAMVLMNVDPAELKAGNKFAAIVQWVKEGGNLVICQNPQWQKMQGWGNLLPVTYPAFGGGGMVMQGSAERDEPGQIFKWGSTNEYHPTTQPGATYRVAVAQAKAEARTIAEIDWPGANGTKISTPYLVRSVYGVGSVTWIAVDMGAPEFVRANLAWPHVWQQIFGWNEDTVVYPQSNSEANQKQISMIENDYAIAHGIDLGSALLSQMEHAGRSASLLLVTAVFLGIYWVLAGPGGYLFLRARKEVRFSWFLFAAVATGATLLTFVVVKIVLRGPPELHHVSVVRTAGEAGVVRSRMGLYIPRDNPAEPIALTNTSGDAYITPFPMHPQQMAANHYAGYMQYTVNVRDAMDEGPPLVRVPYRSTLKKLQAKWVGEQAGIEGHPRLALPWEGYIKGQLTNGTGKTLEDVYLVFHYPISGSLDGDWALYLPRWMAGDTVDVASQFKSAKNLEMTAEPRVTPGQGIAVLDRIDRVMNTQSSGWQQWWYNSLAPGSTEQDYSGDSYNAFVMLSIFDRLPVVPRLRTDQARFELQRRGARNLDASNVVAAGGLLILGHADGPLPFGLEAGGQEVAGSGQVYYQMILPLDAAALTNAPTTTNPTTQPAVP